MGSLLLYVSLSLSLVHTLGCQESFRSTRELEIKCHFGSSQLLMANYGNGFCENALFEVQPADK